jgi:hypothetical protein
MKKLDTLKKALDTITNEAIIDIISNADFDDASMLTINDKLALIEFAELKKALDNKNYTLVLDINFDKFKSDDIIFSQCSLIDVHNKRALHLYRKTRSTYDISFSSDKNTLAKLQYFDAVNTDYDLKHKYKKDMSIKDTYLHNVTFDNVFNACKLALSILESELSTLQAEAEANEQ